MGNHYGIVVYTLKLDTVLNDLSMIKFQLIGGTSINIVSVTNSQGEELLYKYDELTNEIAVIANNTDLINITYEVKGLFQEISIGAYISYIDLSPYSNINFKAEINLLGEYTIYSEPENVDIQQGKALTTITLNIPSQYIIIAEETLPTNTTTSSQAETINETITYSSTSTVREQSGTTFTTTSTTTESSVEKTITEHSITTSNKIETYKTTYVEGTSSNTTMWLSAIIVLLIIVAIAIAIKKR